MGDCCSTENDAACNTPPEPAPVPKKSACPACATSGRLIERKTLLQQLKHAYLISAPPEPFYFCGGRSCDTVYFSQAGTTYAQDALRQKVGQKSTDSSRTLCYCFDVTADTVEKELAESGTSAAKEFVMAQVKLKTCACDVRNPSGSCCLPDFPKK